MVGLVPGMTSKFLMLGGINHPANGRFGACAGSADDASERLLWVEGHSFGSAAFWLTNAPDVRLARTACTVRKIMVWKTHALCATVRPR